MSSFISNSNNQLKKIMQLRYLKLNQMQFHKANLKKHTDKQLEKNKIEKKTLEPYEKEKIIILDKVEDKPDQKCYENNLSDCKDNKMDNSKITDIVKKKYYDTIRNLIKESIRYNTLYSNTNINMCIKSKKYINIKPRFPNKSSCNGYNIRLKDKDLKVYLYIVCYNESFIIPHLLKHYHYVDKIFIYDNCSDDNSYEILKKDDRCEIIYYSSKFDDTINQYIKNNCWKQHIGECDYCIVQDADEFLYHTKGLHYILKESKKQNKIFSYFPIKGINMVSEKTVYTTDSFLYEQVFTGYFDRMYSKLNIFSPNLIKCMNYTAGSHESRPEAYNGLLSIGPEIILLHFKFIGGIEKLKKRQLDYSKRLSNCLFE